MQYIENLSDIHIVSALLNLVQFSFDIMVMVNLCQASDCISVLRFIFGSYPVANSQQKLRRNDRNGRIRRTASFFFVGGIVREVTHLVDSEETNVEDRFFVDEVGE
jgi:hypothetical protein